MRGWLDLNYYEHPSNSAGPIFWPGEDRTLGLFISKLKNLNHIYKKDQKETTNRKSGSTERKQQNKG